VKKPISQYLDPYIGERAPLQPGKQMMPLQDLVQQNAIKKSAQSEAKQVCGPVMRTSHFGPKPGEGNGSECRFCPIL